MIMTISTKGRYGLTLMLDISENQGEKAVKLKDAASRQDISEKYLEQIAMTLSKGGMLQSCRGSNGGYRLSRRPEDYSVGEILTLLEGNLSPAPCASEFGNSCTRKENCANGILWEKINDAIHSVVDNVTLEDMREWQRIY